MNDWRVEVYAGQLVYQAKVARWSVARLDEAMADDTAGVVPVFAALQSLLAAGSMIFMLLAPNPPDVGRDGSPLDADAEAARRRAIERGKELRAKLGLKKVLPPLTSSRNVRNAFEHFDERLDTWLEDGNRYVMDRNIGNKDNFSSFEGYTTPPRHLRFFDPGRNILTVLDQEISVQDLYDAIAVVGDKAQAWIDAH